MINQVVKQYHQTRLNRCLGIYPCMLLCLLFATPAWAGDSSKRGEYLTTILGCGGCHTQGALLGEPNGVWLAGSTIGVAYTEDTPTQSPGIIFPANLTPHKETGIGNWSAGDLVRFLRTGMDHYGKQANTVMPWPNYALLNDRDINAVAKYLLSLEPVDNPIPDAIAAGDPINESFVRIGVYLFIPEESASAPQESPTTEDEEL